MSKKSRKKSKLDARPTWRIESGLRKYQGHKAIAGCDEVGVGALAGPVVVAAVILDPKKPIRGLNDSKKLSPKRREELAVEIRKKAKDYTIAFYPACVVDRLNPHKASRLGMESCVRGFLLVKPSFVITDAMKLENCAVPHRAVVHGDSKSVSVAAASILAKVARDDYMIRLSRVYPEYGFEQSKGYGTADHMNAIKEYGPCEEHRFSCAPVRKFEQRVEEKEWEDFSL